MTFQYKTNVYFIINIFFLLLQLKSIPTLAYSPKTNCDFLQEKYSGFFSIYKVHKVLNLALNIGRPINSMFN